MAPSLLHGQASAELVGYCVRSRGCYGFASSRVLPQDELARVVALRRVLGRSGVRVNVAELASLRLAPRSECANSDEGERHGDGDADGGDDRNDGVLQGLHADGHWGSPYVRRVYAVYTSHYAS